ncbi:hypothetical protein Tco_0116824, partial [Tanacetum coccineum]
TGQMTYLVASLTPDSVRSYVIHSASFTQGTVSTIPFVGSIRPEGFLPPILLLVVIIATVVVVAVGGVPSILKLSFMVIRVSLGPIFLFGLSVLAMVAACASRAAATLSATSFSGTGSLPSGCVDLTSDEDPTDEDGDIRMGDSTCVLASLGGEIFSGRKKCQESNIGDSDNTGDGGKIVGGAIGACGGIGNSLSVASYACMTFIYGHHKKVRGLPRLKDPLVKPSEKLGEVFPSEAGK